MRWGVFMEESGRVREALRARGHDAVSVDFLPSALPGPHIQADVFEVLQKEKFDVGIFFPTCTYLCSSGLHWNKRVPGRWAKTVEALNDVRRIWDCGIPKIAIENPIGCLSTKFMYPSQIIQPWMFGHAESKATCLWLRGLPNLVPTDVIKKPVKGYWDNQTPSGQNKLGPSADRALLRSRTYQGIADAMATQWGDYVSLGDLI